MEGIIKKNKVKREFTVKNEVELEFQAYLQQNGKSLGPVQNLADVKKVFETFIDPGLLVITFGGIAWALHIAHEDRLTKNYINYK